MRLAGKGYWHFEEGGNGACSPVVVVVQWMKSLTGRDEIETGWARRLGERLECEPGKGTRGWEPMWGKDWEMDVEP